ncbi:MAG: UvrD-helicase domain-containing protein [Ignavibacteriales bacterium]|nr:UvrD-helicase domain-containing protein [Ignavibacteriales bacterium]
MTFLQELNPQQREAVKALDGPVLIVAGAGSGKTRVLTYRIAHLLSIGVPAYQILALTFTNKAANEMKERIHKIVGDKSYSLWMGTFHSIFARVLRYEGTKIGFEKNFSIYDDGDSVTWTLEFTNATWLSLGSANGTLYGTPNNSHVGGP